MEHGQMQRLTISDDGILTIEDIMEPETEEEDQQQTKQNSEHDNTHSFNSNNNPSQQISTFHHADEKDLDTNHISHTTKDDQSRNKIKPYSYLQSDVNARLHLHQQSNRDQVPVTNVGPQQLQEESQSQFQDQFDEFPHSSSDKQIYSPNSPLPFTKPQPYPLNEGIPVTDLSHRKYTSVKARFLLYTAGYGQFNNQVVSLINAILMSQRAKAVLVLPFAKLGKESKWDAQKFGLDDEIHTSRRLVGDYFNYSRLAESTPVILPDQFFSSQDGYDLLDKPSVEVAFRSGGYYRFLFRHASISFLNRKRSRVVVRTPPMLVRRHMHHFCDLSPEHALRHVDGWGPNSRFLLMPIIFRRHNLNCSVEESKWISIRKSLVPRNEFLYAVDQFLDRLPKPVVSIHLRLFLNGDVDAFEPKDLVDMFLQKFEEQLSGARTLFIAYSPSSDISVKIVELLNQQFRGLVVDGKNMKSFFRTDDRAFAEMALSNVIFDMWVCVKSDYFIGRLGSSLSWNTVYWRQALREEYDLPEDVVQNPLWYTLESFSLEGKRRNEGPQHGVRYVSD